MKKYTFLFPDETIETILAIKRDTAIRMMNKKLADKNEIDRLCMFETQNPTEFIFVKYYQNG
jgi:hypothetical protein